MLNHKWRIRIDLTCDDGESSPSTVRAELRGGHNVREGVRAVNECLAMDVARTLLMLHAAENWIAPSSNTDTFAVFEYYPDA